MSARIGLAAQVALITALACASGAVAAPAVPAGMVPSSGPQDTVVYSVPVTEQAHVKGYWSQARMESATPGTEPGASAPRPRRSRRPFLIRSTSTGRGR